MKKIWVQDGYFVWTSIDDWAYMVWMMGKQVLRVICYPPIVVKQNP